MIEIRGKNPLTIALALLIILFSPIAPAFAFSTLSIQPAGFSSNDKYLDGEAWLLTVSEDGNSQYAQGTIPGEDIKSSDGKYAKNDLTIKTSILEQSCDYQLKQSYDPNIYKFDIQKTGSNVASWEAQDLLESCKDKSNFYWAFISSWKDKSNFYWPFISETGWIFIMDVYCITRDKVGVPGIVKTPSANFKAQIQMTAGGKTETGTLSSIDAKSVRLSNIGYAHWAGSLTSGEQCPDLSAEGYNIIHNEYGRWVLNKQYLYNQYLSYKQNSYDSLESALIREIESDPLHQLSAASVSSLKSTISTLDNKARDATEEFGYSDFKVSSNSISSGQAKLELDKIIQFPVITMHVKADWLGIVAPVGKPDITSVSSLSFEEGKTGYIKVTVKNVGDATASFGVSATCDSPFKQVGTAYTISNLASGNSKSISIPITADTNKDVTKYCTVKAYDLNNPKSTDSKQVKVSATPIRLCTPGEERCDSETLKVCNSDGSAWKKIESDKCKKTACLKDSNCDDGNSCTNDVCDGGKCLNICQASATCVCEEVCEYVKDGQTIEKTMPAKDCCEAKGGRWDPGYDAPWYKFWEKDEPARCLIPKISILGIILIIVGIVLVFTTPLGPYSLIISGIGLIWLLLKLYGL